jgi:hypothetical protein
MKEPGLDHRHRDKNGEISRKHGSTLVRALRKSMGPVSLPDAGTRRSSAISCINSTSHR